MVLVAFRQRRLDVQGDSAIGNGVVLQYDIAGLRRGDVEKVQGVGVGLLHDGNGSPMGQHRHQAIVSRRKRKVMTKS